MAERLIDFQREHPGCWIAVKDGEVIATNPRSYALMNLLMMNGVRADVVFWSPPEGAPEVVGLG